MKITIDVDMDLEMAKHYYRKHFAYPSNFKVTRSDIANWFGNLVTADVEAVQEDESEEN